MGLLSQAMGLEGVLDRQWMNSAFLAGSYVQSELDRRASTFTDAAIDFTDTMIGGSLCINPIPQFTRSADVRRPGTKVGRYWQEAIKSNWQVINVRLGVPAFNSLILFVTNFYNSEAGILARSGSSPSTAYSIGRVGGAIVSLMSWKLQAVRMIGQGYQFFTGKGSSKFYTVKPAMPLFWNAAQTMANQIAVYTGIVPRVLGADPSVTKKTGYEFSQSDIKKMVETQPLLFHRSGTIDILSVAQRAQRLARSQLQLLDSLVDQGRSGKDIVAALSAMGSQTPPMKTQDHLGYLDSWFKANASGANKAIGDFAADEVADVSTLAKEGADTGFMNFLSTEFDDGAAFVGIRVNPVSGVSDSFSNTVGESELASTLNNMASGAKNLRFTFANGNIHPVVNGIKDAVGEFLQGGADSIGFGGIVAALTGGAFTDVPSMWKGSSANLQGASYTIPLVSPYNHPFAKYLFCDIPLSIILAMGMPLSTGKQSYTSPFICEIYDKGHTQSRLAIVDQMTVRRGVNTLAYNRNMRAMGYEVSISFKYLDNLIHMPIAQGISLTGVVANTITTGGVGLVTSLASGLFDDDSMWSDYIATLSSVGLADQVYPSRKLKLALTREMVKWDQMTSPTRLASFFADSAIGELAKMFYAGTIRN